MSVVPGWYPDPWDGRRQRWFDGVNWTGHVSGPSRPDPQELAATWTRRARTALWVQVAVMAVSGVLMPVVWGQTVAQLRDLFAAAQSGAVPVDPGFTASPVSALASMVGQVVGMAGFAVVVVVAIWSYRLAAALPGRVRMEPVLVGLSWFIPLAGLVLPFVALWRAAAGDRPGRRAVLGWAVLWGGYSAGAVVALGGALFGGWPAWVAGGPYVLGVAASVCAVVAAGRLGKQLEPSAAGR